MITLFEKYKLNEEEYYYNNIDYANSFHNEIFRAMYRDSIFDENIKWVKNLVINKKININCKDYDSTKRSYTPLLKSIEMLDYSHTYIWLRKITFFLINNGADPNLDNDYGQTPLMLASSLSEDRIVKKLIEKGAKIDAQDKYGDTAFIKAVKSRNGFDHITVGELINAGADWFLKNNENEYPYMLMKKRISDYYMKSVIAKNHPEQYENALMIVNSKKYNL